MGTGYGLPRETRPLVTPTAASTLVGLPALGSVIREEDGQMAVEGAFGAHVPVFRELTTEPG